MYRMLLLIVLTIFTSHRLLASEPPIHFLDAEWPTGNKTGYSEMSIDITVEQDDMHDHFFYAHTIYLNGKNTENNEPNVMYAGFQNNGWTGEDWIGKVAIFSVWGAYDGIEEAKGWGTKFYGEGTGYSVRFPYEWNVGTTYRLTVKVIRSTARVNEFAAFLTDLNTQQTQRIGRILMKKDRGLMHNPVTFHEVYMYKNDEVPSKCDEHSTSVATFTNARADGKILTPEIYLRDKYSECESISGDEYVEGGLRSWVKPGL